MKNIIMLMLLTILITACSSTSKINIGGNEVVIPNWVLDPQTIPDEAGIIYGIGSAKTNDFEYTRYMADEAAFRNIQQKWDARRESQFNETGSAASEATRRNMDLTNKSELKGIMRGVRVVKRFINKDGTLFSLAVLDTTRLDAGYESELNK